VPANSCSFRMNDVIKQVSVCSHNFDHINNTAAFGAESERSLASGVSGLSQSDKNRVDRRHSSNP